MSSSVNLRGIRTGTPVPRIDREKPVSCPVVTYKLSPEELERYRNLDKPGSKKGDKRMDLTKEQYLELRLQEHNRTRICTDLGIKPPTLYNALERWGIKDRQVEDELLASMREAAAADETSTNTVSRTDEPNISSPQDVQNSVDKSEQPEPFDYVMIRIPLSFSNEPYEFFQSDKPKPITRTAVFGKAFEMLNAAVEWAYRDMIELVGSDLAHEQIQKYVDKQLEEFAKVGEGA